MGYKRASSAVLALEEPIASFLQPDGTLRKLPNVGPSSTRVIVEVLQTGTSATVERAIADSGQASDIKHRRNLRGQFLSRAQVVAALTNRKLAGPRLEDYRGDLQMHSTWSDGSQTLADIVEGGLARGYSFCAVTDHSYGLKIAGGVSMTDLRKQHREIDILNGKYRGRFRLIKGIEANIRADGSVDMEQAELRELELVVAAPHSALRPKRIRQPGWSPRSDRLACTFLVTLAGGNTIAPWRLGGLGRGLRGGQEANVAIEIDGDPSRRTSTTTRKRAVDAGCLFALDSDAHSTAELAYSETRSRTLVSPVCPRIASSIAGRPTSCSHGAGKVWLTAFAEVRRVKKPDLL